MHEIVRQLQPGDLVALFYRSRAEQLDFLIPYIKLGLAQNERCLYIADDLPVRLVLKKLEDAGVNVAAAQKAGALDVLTKSETYLRGGGFAPQKMIADLSLELRACLERGFSGLRGSGDMGWALESAQMLDQMVEYQRRLYEIFPMRFLAVCQYDESRFSAEVREKLEMAHNVVIRDGKLVRKPVSQETFITRALENVRIMIESGMPREQVLSRLATEGERIAGQGAVASILLLDQEGLLRNAASPNLPADYLQAIDRLKPDPALGTCAAAAATGSVVITRDFCADEKWGELRHLPTALGFVGAWSMPIKDVTGKVLGTFGTYYREPRDPTEAEQKAVARLAEAAALALGAG